MVRMIPPGLLPESSEPRRSPAAWFFGIATVVLLLSLVWSVFALMRVTRQRDKVLAQNRRIQRDLKELESKAEEPGLKEAPAPSPQLPPAPPPPVPVPAPAAEARVAASRDLAAEHVTRGLQEFRAGRYEQAERQFFRGFPDSALYLALTTLAERNWREAFGFLSRAMAVDPNWLRRVRPRDLFGSEEAYDAMLSALEEQMAKSPADPDLKTLLAYLRYHDKGAAYAKALLIEATNAKPEHEEARAFLEVLGP